MPPFAIRTDGLTRDFDSVRAVDHLSLEIPPGIVFGFLGPNGAGKTTTIRLLLGLLEPTAGSSEVLGYDTRTQADEIRMHSGALLEYSGIYERLSAEDNLEFYGRVWRLPESGRKARIEELLTHMDLWERRKELAGTWSRGMKQKLAVARSLLHRPDLVFLDEPTAGLDPMAAVALREDLASLTQQGGVTVFLTTHNLAEAEKLCQQVAVIREGRLLAVGTLDELRLQAGGPSLEISGKGFKPEILNSLRSRMEIDKVEMQDGRLIVSFQEATDAAPLVNLLVSSGVQIEEVRRGKASLEEAFLALMEEGTEEE
jgi:ABC-2 type transport system ATP-binding protein